MKTLLITQTQFVSGGAENSGLAKYKIDAPLNAFDRYLPSMRFDATRTAPGDTKEDNYNGLNDQGQNV